MGNMSLNSKKEEWRRLHAEYYKLNSKFNYLLLLNFILFMGISQLLRIRSILPSIAATILVVVYGYCFYQQWNIATKRIPPIVNKDSESLKEESFIGINTLLKGKSPGLGWGSQGNRYLLMLMEIGLFLILGFISASIIF